MKPKIKKTKAQLASQSVEMERPETLQPIELKSEVTLPKDVQPEPELATAMTTEPQQAVENVISEIEIKKKPKTIKTKMQLAPESVEVEQSETVNPLELKSELIVAEIQSEPTPQVEIKKDVKLKKTKPAAAKDETPVAPAEIHTDVAIEPVPMMVTLESKEDKTQMSEMKVEALAKPKIRKTILKHSPSQEVPEPTPTEMAPQDITIETKSKIQVPVETRIVLEPKERSEVTLMAIAHPEEPVELTGTSEVAFKQINIQTKTKKRVTIKAPTDEIETFDISQTELPQEPQESKPVDQEVSIQSKSSKRIVKSVAQSSEIVTLEPTKVTVTELPEPAKQVESTTIELKRPKEPKKIQQVPETILKESAPQEMTIETKSTKRESVERPEDAETHIETFNISQTKLDVTGPSPAIIKLPEEPKRPETKEVDQEVSIEKKSKKIIVKTVVQSDEIVTLEPTKVAISELPEPVQQIESTTIELKRPKESKKVQKRSTFFFESLMNITF